MYSWAKNINIKVRINLLKTYVWSGGMHVMRNGL